MQLKNLISLVSLVVLILFFACERDVQPNPSFEECHLIDDLNYGQLFRDFNYREDKRFNWEGFEDWLVFLEDKEDDYYSSFSQVVQDSIDLLLTDLENLDSKCPMFIKLKALRMRANQANLDFRFDNAIADLEQAIIIYETNKENGLTKYDSLELAEVYNVMGFSYQEKRDLGRARAISVKARKLYNELGKIKDVANEYASFGNVLTRGAELDDAKDFLEKGVCIWKSIWSMLKEEYPDQISLQDTLNYNGTFFMYGNYFFVVGETELNSFHEKEALIALDSAQYYYHKVFEGFPSLNPTTMGPFLVNCMGLANVFISRYRLDQTVPDSSLFYINKATDAFYTVYPPGSMPMTIQSSFDAVASLYYAKNDSCSKALKLSEKAIKGTVPEASNPFDAATLRSNDVLDYAYLMRAYHFRGLVCNICYEKSDKTDIGLLENALQSHQNTLIALDKMRVDFASDESIESLINRTHLYFSEATKSAIQLYEYYKSKGQPNNKYLDIALQMSDKGKGLTLRLASYRALAVADTNSTSLRQKLANKEINLRVAVNRQRGLNNSEELLKAEEHYANFIGDLKNSKNNPVKQAYYQERFNDNIPSIRRIQKEWLDEKTAVIEYELGLKEGYAFIITNGSATAISFPVDTFLLDLLNNYKNNLREKKSLSKIYDISNDLYKRIFEPIQERLPSIKNLIIVPDRELSSVIFGALLTNPSPMSPEKAFFLLDEYAIAYSYSLSSYDAILELSSFKSVDTDKYAAFIADPSDYQSEIVRGKQKIAAVASTLNCNNDSITSLRDTTKEISERYYHIEAYNKAKESTFKLLSPTYQILQISAHGCINKNYPMETSIQFFEDKSTGEDGMLTAREIYELPLVNSSLAILSNCNSGQGKEDFGEGVQSLARAFIYAGCEGIIATMRAVEVQRTAKLISYFYKYLDEYPGESPHRALWRAKKDLKKDVIRDQASIAEWANYIYIGSITTSIQKK